MSDVDFQRQVLDRLITIEAAVNYHKRDVDITYRKLKEQERRLVCLEKSQISTEAVKKYINRVMYLAGTIITILGTLIVIL